MDNAGIAGKWSGNTHYDNTNNVKNVFTIYSKYELEQCKILHLIIIHTVLIKLYLSTNPPKLPSGYKIYQLHGTMNKKQGIFEIGVNQKRIIDHRFFRPLK